MPGNAAMPQADLSDEEHAAVTAAVRRSIADDRYPLSPRLDPLKSALAKLDSEISVVRINTNRSHDSGERTTETGVRVGWLARTRLCRRAIGCGD
jgi:hypothetical protein